GHVAVRKPPLSRRRVRTAPVRLVDGDLPTGGLRLRLRPGTCRFRFGAVADQAGGKGEVARGTDEAVRGKSANQAGGKTGLNQASRLTVRLAAGNIKKRARSDG